jgi:hypothetical protein
MRKRHMNENSMSDLVGRPRPPGRRRRRLLFSAVSLAVGLAALVGSTGIAGASVATLRTTGTPTADVVGTGLVNCAVVTGEIGFSPASISGGSSVEVINIWLLGQKCTPVKGKVGTKPVPSTVSLSMSLTTTNVCPMLGVIGGGTANLAYNYPVTSSPMIDPSTAMNVAVTESGPFWNLQGQVNWGSYLSPLFKANIKPVGVGSESCSSGITSMYVTRGTLSNV